MTFARQPTDMITGNPVIIVGHKIIHRVFVIGVHTTENKNPLVLPALTTNTDGVEESKENLPERVSSLFLLGDFIWNNGKIKLVPNENGKFYILYPSKTSGENSDLDGGATINLPSSSKPNNTA